jgi:hypothetical protein
MALILIKEHLGPETYINPVHVVSVEYTPAYSFQGQTVRWERRYKWLPFFHKRKVETSEIKAPARLMFQFRGGYRRDFDVDEKEALEVLSKMNQK